MVVYEGSERIEDIIKFDEELSLEYILEKRDLKIDIEEYKRRHKELFIELLRSSLKSFFITVLEEDDRIIGLMWIGIRIDTVTYEKICYVYDIEVRKEYRKKGIGTLLIKEGFKICKNNGVGKIALMVDLLNRNALKWYLGLGFTVERFYLVKSLNSHTGV